MVKTKRKYKTAAALFIVLFLLVFIIWSAVKIGDILEQKRQYTMYPLAYETEIYKSSAENGLNEYLVMGLIRAESNFQSDAVSSAGAVGLMQIMPETGQWLSLKMGLDSFDPDMLYDPAFNIQMGCYFLAMLLDNYQNVEAALAAYNAGMGAVTAWLADDAYSSDGNTLEYIPYNETRDYVNKVQQYAEKYEQLYGQAG